MPNSLNKKLNFAILFSGMLLVSAVATANTCNEGIGGTGHSEDGFGGTGVTAQKDGYGGTGHSEDGFGGTGVTAQKDGYGGTGHSEDGFGGTGVTAQKDGFGGTGIIGIITGFASVCVNGVEAHFDSNTHVDIDGTTSSIDYLKIGDLVAIDAKGQGEEVSAKTISVVHAVVGRVDSINMSQHQINVLGQQILLSPTTQGGNSLKVGQTIAVSGFVDSKGAIQALRVDQVSNNTPSLITGTMINGKVLGNQVSGLGNHLNGKNVQAIGKWDGKNFTAIDVKQNAMDRVMRAGYALNAQGVIYQSGTSQSLYTLGKQVNINVNTKVYGDKNIPNSLVIVRGQVDKNGRVETKEIEYHPFERTLERGGSKELPSTDGIKNKSTNEINEGSKPQKITNQSEHASTEKLNANEKPEKIESSVKIKKIDKVDKPEKLDKVEKPEKVDRVEKIEVPERVDVPEKPEKYTY
jgi:hypothetical protein